uniref:Putative transcriptional regulatory protein n=1 Tax=Talaromyces marneffei PM1 TaxID=1077442 RepID=A0A093VRY3_TALMA
MATQSSPNLSGRQTAPQRLRKRAQVARACDECRMRRTKCDNKVPCSKCSIKGLDCSNSGIPKASTLSEARDEITWLKQRVQQLEAQVDRQRNDSDNLTTSTNSSRSGSQDPRSVVIDTSHTDIKRFPGGIQFRAARSPNDAWFGPSSSYFFVQRLSAFLNLKLSQSCPAHQLLPISAKENKLLDRPDNSGDVGEEDLLRRPISFTKKISTQGVYLNLIQEEYFINFFWQTHHTSLFPIIDEANFKKHYQSLWVTGGTERRPSALVDIVIAMCMQYYLSTLPSESQGILVEGKDAMVAGRWHYWRGQTLLTHELESPSISTLQCHLLCAIYLCGGSFHNRMENSVSLSVRTAYTLGLHLDPPSNMPERDREMRRRLWWAVYLMDSKAGMKLGRPFMLHDSYVMPCLPNDSLEAAAISGSTFAPIGDNATWLSFNLYQTKLYMACRGFGKAHPAPPAMVDSVPEPLRSKRSNNGTPFSTDGTSPSIEQFAPMWLQRQRLLLELTYHHLCVNLYRPIISFTSRLPPGGVVEEMALRCASHAIMLSKITQQVLAETSILDGWHDAYYCQWNSTMTLIGFVMVYPHTSLAAEARAAIDLALNVFDNFGAKFAIARNAANIVRDLCEKIDSLAKANQVQHVATNEFTTELVEATTSELLQEVLPSQVFVSNPMFENIYPHEQIDVPDFNFFDMAVDVDFWNDLDTLWPETDAVSQYQIPVQI